MEEKMPSDRFSTKQEASERRSLPRCPPVPSKPKRSSVYMLEDDAETAKRICFISGGELNPNYDRTLDLSYFEQIYPVHCFIAEGSYGQVFRVEDKFTKIQYAVKRLKQTVSTAKKYAEVANNELVGIHQNCVRYYFAWQEKRFVYLLLEACQMSLAHYASKLDGVSETVLWDVLYDISQALNHLHSRKLIHLDVKPGNIMIQGIRFKLGDFGILINERLMSREQKFTEGDAKYLAPEVLQHVYTSACDIFGLGITLLELATNVELPSEGDLWLDIRCGIRPPAFYSRTTVVFRAIINKMMTLTHTSRPSAALVLVSPNMRVISDRDILGRRVPYTSEVLSNIRSRHCAETVVREPHQECIPKNTSIHNDNELFVGTESKEAEHVENDNKNNLMRHIYDKLTKMDASSQCVNDSAKKKLRTDCIESLYSIYQEDTVNALKPFAVNTQNNVTDQNNTVESTRRVDTSNSDPYCACHVQKSNQSAQASTSEANTLTEKLPDDMVLEIDDYNKENKKIIRIQRVNIPLYRVSIHNKENEKNVIRAQRIADLPERRSVCIDKAAQKDLDEDFDRRSLVSRPLDITANVPCCSHCPDKRRASETQSVQPDRNETVKTPKSRPELLSFLQDDNARRSPIPLSLFATPRALFTTNQEAKNKTEGNGNQLQLFSKEDNSSDNNDDSKKVDSYSEDLHWGLDTDSESKSDSDFDFGG